MLFGPLTRSDLDRISTTRPIIIRARSCHEFTLNSATLDHADVTQDLMDGWTQSAQDQSDLYAGHFWEQGMFSIPPNMAPMVANPEKLRAGLELMRDFMHAKGVTFGTDPRRHPCEARSGHGELRHVQLVDAIPLGLHPGQQESGLEV